MIILEIKISIIISDAVKLPTVLLLKANGNMGYIYIFIFLPHNVIVQNHCILILVYIFMSNTWTR